MKKQKQRCTLLIGRKSEDYFGKNKGKKVFNGNTTQTNLFFNSVLDAKKVAAIAGIDCYQVMKVDEDDYYFHDAIYQTPDIKKFWANSKKKKKDYDAKRRKRVKAINKMPKEFKLGNFGLDGLEVIAKRSTYEYKPTYSSTIQGYISLEIKVDGETKDDWFNLDYYFTKDDRAQVKKFQRDFFYDIYHRSPPANFNVKRFMIEMKMKKREIENKIAAVE